MTAMTLAAALRPDRANNLHALRLIAASAVVISHAWPLAQGAGTPEPLEALTGHSLGGWAVVVFFFLSGLLIAQSAARRDAATFWRARALRILPGLAAALVLTLILAALSGGRVTLPVAADYLLRGLTLVSLEHAIPGAYPANPMPGLVNGPLWSLFHEVAAYAICFVAVRSGLMARAPVVLAALALALWGVVALDLPGIPARLTVFAPLFLAYATGMTVWRFAARWPLGHAATLGIVLAGLGAAVLLGRAGAGGAIWPVAVLVVAQATLWLAFCTPAIRLRHDLSFGVYVLGWPIAQYMLHLIPGLSAPGLAALSLAVTLPFAGASWLIIERPALRLAKPRPQPGGGQAAAAAPTRH